ncbi:peptide deformylase 1B [Actinidia rufa]|uniref:Peptide deformylase n=1 Tax=Actinidia rufa TaxID=165716 RepID=A0A7J0ELD8_9ERIC|nr:peptide deformylase 1B [Actinidia rufa]
MACSIWLHTSPLSPALLPFISRRTNILSSNLRRFHRSVSAPNRCKPPPIEVRAQAKRSFSLKDDEVASPADLSFQAPLKIVEYPYPILRAKNKRIDTFDDNLKKLVDEMFDVMYKVLILSRDLCRCVEGVLFFDRMTEEVIDSIRAELQVIPLCVLVRHCSELFRSQASTFAKCEWFAAAVLGQYRPFPPLKVDGWVLTLLPNIGVVPFIQIISIHFTLREVPVSTRHDMDTGMVSVLDTASYMWIRLFVEEEAMHPYFDTNQRCQLGY